MESTITEKKNIKNEIAKSYDKKIIDINDLNVRLAEDDFIENNHDGIFLPGDSLEYFQARIKDEKTHLEVIHSLELNQTRFGALFLKYPTKDMTILDAGCGAGGSAILIHQMYGSKIEGFTLSEQQALYANAAAKKYGYEKSLKFSQGDMTKLNVQDNYYDTIWACASTEHVSNLDDLFKEFKRVAKNNSRLVIIAWCASDPDVKKLVDNHYLTDINQADSYLTAAARHNWYSSYHLDMTSQITPYWQLRSYKKTYTNAESFMTPGFLDRKIEYHMFCFDLKK